MPPSTISTLSARSAASVAALALLVTVSACDPSGTTGSAADPAPSSADRSSAAAGVDPVDPLVQGFDVCSVLSAQQVRSATGQVGDPSTRGFSRVPGYPGLTDQCGFGVSFDSFSVSVDVGMAPATRASINRLPGKPAPGVDVKGIGEVARAIDSGRFSAVSFVKGTTFVRVQALKPDGPSRIKAIAQAARQVAAAVPAEPPVSDEETSGRCARLDPAAVKGVLGSEPALSRSFAYQDTSSVCSFASGVGADARFITVSTYTNTSAGPFLADQESSLPSKQVLGVSKGKAFTIPGTAYFIGDDGQAVAVSGTIGGTPTTPATPTPALTALLDSAARQLQ